MADSTLYMPKHPDSAADTVPIKLADNGDGTYSLSVATSGSAGPIIYLRGTGGDVLPLATYDNGDGTYSLAVVGA